jgi:hypothetical protein
MQDEFVSERIGENVKDMAEFRVLSSSSGGGGGGGRA